MMVWPMPTSSPGNPYIEVVYGIPTEIENRGTQIADLGTDMQNSANLLRRLVDNGAEMEGQAIDKLSEFSAEVYHDLDRGGVLYSAVAPYLITYAKDLDDSQTAMATIIADLDEIWASYNRKSEEAEMAQSQSTDADDPELEAVNAEVEALRSEWDDRARDYDTEWDSWYTAFTNAADGIRNDTDEMIEDTWDDDFGGFLDTMADILAVAGIVLAIAGLIFGGPLIAIIAGVVAVLTLAVALTRAIRGEGSWFDVALAVIGVIPFIGPSIRGLRAIVAAEDMMAVIRGGQFLSASGGLECAGEVRTRQRLRRLQRPTFCRLEFRRSRRTDHKGTRGPGGAGNGGQRMVFPFRHRWHDQRHG